MDKKNVPKVDQVEPNDDLLIVELDDRFEFSMLPIDADLLVQTECTNGSGCTADDTRCTNVKTCGIKPVEPIQPVT